MEIEIPGLVDALCKCDKGLVGEAARRFLERCCITICNEAKDRAPVDMGLLRASITYEVDRAELPLQAVVGTNVHYAPYMEFGTGLFAEGDSALKRGSGPHWPPAHALDRWAHLHGWPSGAAVARVIGQRGGLLPRRFLRGAFEASKDAIQGFLTLMAQEIGIKWRG